jgi:hypothetical protein
VKDMNRRTFLKSSVGALPLATAATAQPAWAQDADFKSDVDILNFALIAEYFLSAFYREGSPTLSSKEAGYVSDIGADEDAHIAALTATVQDLGGTPTIAPAIDYGDVFNDRKKYLRFALRFENLFGGAYLGAAGQISNKEILQAAAGIYGTEERHAAVIADLLKEPAEGGVFNGAVTQPADKRTVLKALRPFIKNPQTTTVKAAVTL